MASLDDIEELRGALEKGFTAGIGDLLKTFSRLNAVVFQKDTPRVEIIVAIGAATGAQRAFPNAVPPHVKYVRWNFTANFKIITRPESALTQNPGEADADFAARVNANNTLHAAIVSRLRGWASTAAQLTWTDAVNFPNHYIAEALRDSGSPSSLKPQEGNETTDLNFTGQVGIRESAWQA